jgi:hypothetical protein
MKTLYSLSLPFIVCLFVCIGCGEGGLPVHAVEGIITLDGEPLVDATITLYPIDATGNLGYANTDAEGHYKISAHGGAAQGGTTLGTYKIALNKIVPDGRVPTREEEADPNFDARRFAGLERVRDLVPKKYQSPETSELEITVEKGKNVRNFDLLSK